MKNRKNICGNRLVRVLSTGVWTFFFGTLLNAESLTPAVSDWQPSQDSPAAVRDADALRFPCAFAEGADRVYWDMSLAESWKGKDGLWISYQLENPTAMRAVTLYLKSGEGWYSIYLPMKAGLQTHFLPFSDFERMEDPLGWDEIDGLRLSPWRGSGGEGALRLYRLEAVQSRVLSIDPDEASSLNPEELAFGVERSAWCTRQFTALGIPTVRLDDAAAATADLQQFDCILLPYNAYPSPSLLRALASYVKEGGKLMVFYSASPELAELCGFHLLRYLSSTSDQKWNSLVFRDENWRGPAVVTMPARNLLPVSPGDKARVLADWVDRSGRKQKEPAILISDRAVWVTAVLPSDDGLDQRQMLAGLVDDLVPGFQAAPTAVRRELDAFRIGLGRTVPADEELREQSKVEDALASGHAFLAWNQLQALTQQAHLAVAEDFDAPPMKMRGLWDASGQGLPQGDWDETIQLLAEAGITDLFVYVPRNGGNPIRVLRAAKGRIAVHAWHICWNLQEQHPATLRRYAREGRLQISEEGEEMPWLCPSHPENLEAELRRILDLAETNGIQGVHLDYVRWQDEKPCACESCRQSFQQALGRKADWPGALREGPQHREFLAWRTLQIDRFVKKVSLVMKEQHPQVLLSAAVWPSPEVSAIRVGQNWTHWIKKGLLDFVVVMNYTESVQNFKIWTETQRKLVGRTAKLIVGIGVDSSESRLTPLQVLDQIRVAADVGANGFVLFKLNPSFAGELAPVLSKAYRSREKK